MQHKKLIVFDLDGTLSRSKTVMDAEMAGLLSELLAAKQVAIISGGSYAQFESQFLGMLPQHASLRNLSLFPTCGSALYRYAGAWQRVYERIIPHEHRRKIIDAFHQTFRDLEYAHPATVYGKIIEDRGTQITFSALGQEAPVALKETFDPDAQKRTKLAEQLRTYLPEFSVKIGGSTSIDVTQKGIDKAYGIMQMEKELGITKEDMLFIGDALFEGGNDYPVKKAGVDCIAVTGPHETKEVIKTILGKNAG